MRSPADAALLGLETALPGLALLLDESLLDAALRAERPDAGILGVTIDYLRYKPGTSCLASGILSTESGPHPFYARAQRRDARDKLDKARRPNRSTGPFGRSRFVLEDQAIGVYVFPDDRRIRSLRVISKARTTATLLGKILPDFPNDAALRFRTLRYNPERRWVGTLDIDSTIVGVVRLYSDDGYEAAHRNARAFRSKASLRIAPLLGASDDARALCLGWLPGSRIHGSEGELEKIGEALANLHGQASTGLPDRTPESESAELIEAAAAIGATVPELGASALAIARQVTARMSSGPKVRATLHGDFHARQVVVEGDGVGFLDFDRAASGDRAADFGSFLADLELEWPREEFSNDRIDAARDALAAGYRRAGGSPPSADWIAVHRAASLLKIAPHPFRLRLDAWPERTAALLDHASEALLTASRHCRRSRLEDAAIPALSRALDREIAQAALQRSLPALFPEATEVRVRKVRVLRHKPGRRCLVEYELDVIGPGDQRKTTTVLGKVRAKGADTLGHAAERSLWESGISIPEPLGIVAELGMRAQRKVPGILATSVLASEAGVAISRRIAEALHVLHLSPIVPRRRHTVADELRILGDRLDEVAHRRPGWAGRLDRLLRVCETTASELPGAPESPIHRDFYSDQVLVDGDRVWILDLDLFSRGDPALDAGNFGAHLVERAIRFPSDAVALERAAAAFEERFAELSDRGVLRRVRIFTLLSLVRHVSLSLEIPGRAPFAGAVLDACERFADVTVRSELSAGGPRS